MATRQGDWFPNEKEAVDGYISVGGKRRLISILDRMKKFKFGEKIKAIIIKDE